MFLNCNGCGVSHEISVKLNMCPSCESDLVYVTQSTYEGNYLNISMESLWNESKNDL